MRVEKIKWSSDVFNALEPAFFGDGEQIRNEVESGICELWRVDEIGYLVTRVEVMKGLKELVFVAAVAPTSSYFFSKEVIDYFRVKAKKVGVNTMRVHSRLKGMGRLLSSSGFDYVETIYKARV